MFGFNLMQLSGPQFENVVLVVNDAKRKEREKVKQSSNVHRQQYTFLGNESISLEFWIN